MLYIVSTPIGNLKDITIRAIETLKEVDLIAAEDTRHSKILLNAYDIKTPMTSYFEHNELTKGDHLLALLKEGKKIALITDAGTPGISDPGYKLIRLAKDNNIPVTVVPGPAALIAALSLSGFPSDSFVFEGFLPVKPGARRKKIETFKLHGKTIIFYESPHRVLKTLKDLDCVLENPQVACAREITKKFEELKFGKARDLIDYYSSRKIRGEVVVIVKA